MTNNPTIPKEVIDQLDAKDLAALAGAQDVKSGIDALSASGLKKLASYKPPTQETPTLGDDAATLYQKNILFGARPFVAGIGGGIGAAIAEATRPDKDRLFVEGLVDTTNAFENAFKKNRIDARAEEAAAEKRSPKLATGMAIGTALGTAPLFAGKMFQGAQAVNAASKAAPVFEGAGLAVRMGNAVANTGRVAFANTGQAAKLGGAFGLANALGHADNLKDAATMIGGGALLGAGTQVAGNVLSAAAPVVIEATKKGALKTASALTGISEKEIQTYVSRAAEVKDLLKKSGGDIGGAADQMRETVTRQIQVARQKLGNQIGKALDDPKYWNKTVDGKPILTALDEAISKVSATSARFRPNEINELKNLRDLVRESIGEDGRVALRLLSDLKEELQAIAKPSYMNGSTIFPRGDLAAKASKNAAGEARRLLNAAAPEIEQANAQLARLHRIEELMNKNLIRAGKPESALLAAGSGNNPRNARILKQLDAITGGDAVRQAENLAAARTFGNTQLLPIDATGKAAARMAAAGIAGTAIGGPMLGAATTALTSPASLKLGLDITRLTSQVVGAPLKAVGNAIVSPTARTAIINREAENAIENPIIRGAMNRRMDRLRGAPPANIKKPQGK